MKKFLSLLLTAIMVMAMATVVFADEVDLGISSNGAVDLSSYSEGSLKVVVKRTSDDKGDINNYGVGGLCPAGSWTVAAAYTVTLTSNPALNDVFEYTWDIAKIKADLGDTPNVNFYNNMGVQSVAVVTAAAASAGDATPVTALAVIALASCAAVVVLRKKEA